MSHTDTTPTSDLSTIAASTVLLVSQKIQYHFLKYINTTQLTTCQLQEHQGMQNFVLFCKKKKKLLFYILIFIKHSHQFVYFTNLFNKILPSHSILLSLIDPTLPKITNTQPSSTINPHPPSTHPTIINEINHHNQLTQPHQATSLHHHHHTYQNPKTTNQNHHNPLIKIQGHSMTSCNIFEIHDLVLLSLCLRVLLELLLRFVQLRGFVPKPLIKIIKTH